MYPSLLHVFLVSNANFLSAPRKQSKTYKVPKRPYEAARLDAELKVSSMGGARGQETSQRISRVLRTESRWSVVRIAVVEFAAYPGFVAQQGRT